MRSAKPPTNSRPPTIQTGLRALLIATVGVSLAGCRSGQSPRSMVQITEDPSAIVADFPAPKQRLATTAGKRSRSDRSSDQMKKTDLVSAVAGMPKEFRDEPDKNPSDKNQSDKSSGTHSLVSSKSNQAGVKRSKETSASPESSPESSLANSAPEVDSKPDSAKQPAASATKTAAKSPIAKSPAATADDNVEVSVGGLVSASLTDLSVQAKPEQTEKVEPTEVEPLDDRSISMAVQQTSHVVSTESTSTENDLVESSTTKRLPIRDLPISQTDKPNGIAEALKQSLARLPELSNSKQDRDGPSPTRIGAGSPAHELTEAELFARLLKRISQTSPDDSPIDRERRQIISRYLMVLAGDPESAVTMMDALNETEQNYMKNQLMGLWTMINPKGHPSSGRRVTEALPKFREATRYMAVATDSLSLNQLEFCTEIVSYGQFKPFEGNRFSAGQQVLLYCEVENFAASDRNGRFQTQLQGSYDIYDSAGTKVISQLLPVEKEQSRNRLRDYFLAYQLNLPETLSTGTYRLQLTIEDIVGKKYGQQNIPFEIR